MSASKRIMLTGATGFTGGALAKKLVAQGHTVVALVRPTGNTRSLDALGANLVEGDI